MTEITPVFTETATAEVRYTDGGLVTELEVLTYSVTLDETRTPYVMGTITALVDNPNLVVSLDPYSLHRVVLTITRAVFEPEPWTPVERVFNLYLHEVEADHVTRVLTLTVVSDEAFWLDVAQNDEVPSLRRLPGALNGLDAKDFISEYLLDGPNGIPLVLDPTFTHDTYTFADDTPAAYYKWQNRLPNPSLETNITGYNATGCLIVHDTSWGRPGAGTRSLRVYNPLSANSFVTLGGPGALRYGMTPGKRYIFRGTMRVLSALSSLQAPTARRLEIKIADADSNNRTVGLSEPASTVVGSVTDLEVRFTVPEDATAAWPQLVLGHSTGSVQWDALFLCEDEGLDGDRSRLPEEIWYFDSSVVIRKYTDEPEDWRPLNLETSTHPNHTLTTGGTYPELSAKPYVAIAQAKHDTPYWDVIAAIMDISGLRLYCDELRRWRLKAIGTESGVTHTLSNLTTAKEVRSVQRSINGKPLYADSIAVRYENADGQIAVSRQQILPSRRKTWITDLATPPGSEAAADAASMRLFLGVLNADRILELGCMTDLAVSPGDTCIVPLGIDGDDVELIATAVTFNSGGTMTITTRTPA